jgi:uncharacterized membrane protein YcaP (DUF421 family)
VIRTWLGTSWSEVGLVVLSTAAIFGITIAYVRVVGLRSFSKMSSFDFVMTLAVGSIVASVAVTSTVSLPDGAVGLAALFGVQYVIGRLRSATRFERLVDNSPVVLMIGDRFLTENLARTRVTTLDVKAKLRAANVLDYSTVRAVVLETTGDISVLHGASAVDPDLLEGVIGARELPDPPAGGAD